VEIAFQTCSNVLYAIKRIVEISPLPPEEKDDIYKEILALKEKDLTENDPVE
jgi:hypothetical protein